MGQPACVCIIWRDKRYDLRLTFSIDLLPKIRTDFRGLSVSLFDPGVLIKNNFTLCLRNSSYSGEFTWIGKPEMVCLSHWVDMFQIIFFEISVSRLNFLYYLNYS
jgi:hypothetical protein